MANEFRLLSIGHPLRHPQVDNHSIFNAPAVFDYDAIVIDPGRVFETIIDVVESRAEHFTHSDTPLANGESTATHAGLAEVLRRRQDEFARALERGALVIVFLHPQASIFQVSSFSGLDRYFFLPAPPGLGWDSRLIRGGEGTTAVVSDHGHPFASVLDVLRGDLLYRAHFDDRAPGFAGNAHVLARSAGGAPVAAEFTVNAGRVIFIPAIKQPGGPLAADLGAAILEASRALLGRAQGAPPSWLADVHLSGLPEREGAVERARQALAATQASLEETELARAELSVLRDVLWVENPRVLRLGVERCLALLGFDAAEGGRVRAPEGELLLEVSGSDREVGMGPHYALRARLDEVIEKEQRAPRGLVVVNGFRLDPPHERPQTFDESLRIGAEAMRYGLLTTTELFAAASAARDGLDEATVARIRARLVSTDGLVELDDLLPGSEA